MRCIESLLIPASARVIRNFRISECLRQFDAQPLVLIPSNSTELDSKLESDSTTKRLEGRKPRGKKGGAR
jgi:hypothetical protein